MSSVTRPRGPLPARVYWTRRAIVLVVAFLLVFTIGKLLGGGSDGSSDDGGKASQASGEQQTGRTGATTPMATGPKGKARKPKRVLAQPDGPCDAKDIRVEPVVGRTPNDGDVRIKLALTGKDAACTWTASEETIVVKIVSGPDKIWTSQQCPFLTEQDVVVRSAVATKVTMTWHGRRSDEDCSAAAQWARAGAYHVVAAALGGEPTDTQFELTRPAAVRVTVTPTPKQKSTTKPTDSERPAGG
jgi:hypothetical protein